MQKNGPQNRLAMMPDCSVSELTTGLLQSGIDKRITVEPTRAHYGIAGH